MRKIFYVISGSGGSSSGTSAYGGSYSHTTGQGTTAANRYGTTATHTYGSGSTTATTQSGATATHYYGAGTVATSPTGATAYRPPVPPPTPYYGAAYPASYHPPVVVNTYGNGCYNCGGWSPAGAVAAGAVVGVAVGAAHASSNTADATTSAYNAGVAAGSANTAAATTKAYNAGVAAGTATNYAAGAIYPTLPAGATPIKKNGTTYYLSGNTWFQPSYGANGVYYRVVPTP